jgi:hypothetical protein
MQIIDTHEALAAAIATTPDPDLRRILELRAGQLGGPEAWKPEIPARFHIAEPGDRLADIETALGFSPLVNLLDGSRYPEPEFEPNWEFVQDFGRWVEITFILADGPAEVLLVPDSGSDSAIATAVRAYASSG